MWKVSAKPNIILSSQLCRSMEFTPFNHEKVTNRSISRTADLCVVAHALTHVCRFDLRSCQFAPGDGISLATEGIPDADIASQE